MTRAALALLATLAILTGFASAAAQAPTGRVRLGEHESFTRLVIDNPESRTYFHSHVGRTVEIRIVGGVMQYDLSAARAAIGGGRIAAIRAGERGSASLITITLACDCEANVFDFGGNRIVIDVFEARETETAGAPVQQPAAAAPDAASSDSGAQHAEEHGDDHAGDHRGSPQAATAASSAPQTADEEDEYETARRRLLALLAQAANDGFVTLDEDAAREEFHDAQGTGPAPVNESVRVARTDGKTIAQPERAPSTACIADGVFNDGAVLDGDAGLARISVLRQQLVGEFDTPDRRAAFALSRQYLHLGFGAEAANVLESLGFDDTPALALIEAGELLEEKKPSENGALLRGDYCRGFHAIWKAAALSARNEPEAALASARRADDAVQRLSKPLLAEISLSLGESAASIGDTEEARIYLALAERAGGYDAPRPRLLSALILQAEGDYERADYILRQLTEKEDYIRAPALLARARLHLDAGTQPDEDLLLDLASLAFERRRTEFGEMVQRGRIELLAESGDVAGAVFVLNTDFTPVYGEQPEVIDTVRQTINNRIKSTHAPTRLATLEAFLANPDLIGADALADDIRLAVADALIDTGLSNAAADVLSEVSDARARDRALLAATAAYRRARFADAVTAASEFADEPQFKALIARAHLANGDAAAAADIFSDVDDETAPLVLSALWRLGRWDRAADLLQTNYERLSETERGEPLTAAKRLALAAYMARRRVLPAEAAATLSASNPELYQGFQSFFTQMDAPSSPTLDAAKDLAATTARELVVFEELATDG